MKMSDDEIKQKIKDFKKKEKDIKFVQSIKTRNDLEYLCHKKNKLLMIC